MDDVGLVGPRGVRSLVGMLLSVHVVQAPLGAWHVAAHITGRKS